MYIYIMYIYIMYIIYNDIYIIYIYVYLIYTYLNPPSRKKKWRVSSTNKLSHFGIIFPYVPHPDFPTLLGWPTRNPRRLSPSNPRENPDYMIAFLSDSIWFPEKKQYPHVLKKVPKSSHIDSYKSSFNMHV